LNNRSIGCEDFNAYHEPTSLKALVIRQRHVLFYYIFLHMNGFILYFEQLLTYILLYFIYYFALPFTESMALKTSSS